MKEMKRLLAMLLAVVMLVGVLPTSVFATEVTDPTAPVVAAEVVSEPTEEATEEATEAATTVTEPVLTVAKTSVQHEAVAASEDADVAPAANDSVVVIAGSDYQKSDSGTTMKNIINAMDYDSIDGVLMGGDYDAGSSSSHYSTAAQVAAVDKVIDEACGEDVYRILVQGNHDYKLTPGDGNLLSTTGAHDTKEYGVYVINQEDYPWGYAGYSDVKARTQKAAEGLKTYLAGKAGYDKPIFVITHLPLHITSRNSQGDGKYAKYIYDVLDAAGASGLKIIFLFGHNHSSTYDDYLGGGSIYLPVGSSISIAEEGSSSKYFTDELTFTYMNCGYVGYSNSGACNHLTMTAFEISEDEVIVKRYDTNGEHTCNGTEKVLKAKGTGSGYPSVDTSVVQSGAKIALSASSGDSGDSGETPVESVTKIDGNVSVTAPGLTDLAAEKLTVSVPNGYSAYASYDITPEGYTQGKTATVTITLDEADGFDASRKVVVIDGEKETEKSIENGAVTFTTNHFSTYSIGQRAVSASAGNVYTLDTDGIDAGEEYLIVSTGSDGTGSALSNNSGTSTGIDVTIFGGQITLDNANAVWIFSGATSGTAQNGTSGYYVYPSSTNGEDPVIRNTSCDLIFTDEGYGEYTIKRNSSYSGYYVSSSSDWTYSSSEASVYLFKKTGEGTGSGGGTVTPNEDGWVTVTTPSGGTTTYTYTQATSITAGGKYVIVGNNNDVALLANGTTMEAQGVTITGNSGSQTMTSTTELTEWTFSGTTSGTVYNGTNYLYSSGNGYTFRIDGKDTLYFADNGNNFQIKGSQNNNGYSFYYNGSDWATSRNNTRQYVRLFQLTGSTPGDDATPGLFVKLTGTMEHTVARNLTAEQVIEQYITDIKGYKYEGTSAPGADVTGTEITSELTFEMQDGYNGAVAGDYYVTVYYGEHAVGSIKITVPEVEVTGCTFDKAGSVKVGATGKVRTGANITVNQADGTSYTVPITLDMLSGDFTTAEAGTYDDLTVTYEVQGKTYTINDFTLTVREPISYPEYPEEGAVQVHKTATGIDFQSTGVAQVEISASGIPMNQGVDVLLVLDTSSSMGMEGSLTDGRTRIDVLKECVNALIANLQAERADGSVPDVEMAVVHFNGYTGNKNTNYIGSTARSTSTLGGTLTDDGNGGAWMNVQNMGSNWAANIPDDCSGTNYDHGLLQAYDLLSARQVAESSRKQFVLFMSDGAPFQYNGVNSNSVSSDWENWILGSYTQTEVEALSHVANPEFYYGNNNGNGQKHRVAEAIKGTGTFEIVTYSDTSSSGTTKLEEVSGLGVTMYSVGLALEGTNMPTDVAGQEAILKTIASSEDVFYSVTSAAGLQEAFDDFAGEVLMAATNARFVDQMGAQFNLQMGTIKDLNGNAVEDVENKIEILSYEIWTRADYLAGKCTADKVGDRKLDTDDKPIATVLETITFNENGTEVYSDKIFTTDGEGNKTYINILGDGTQDGFEKGVIYAKSFMYNANKDKAVAVNGVSIPTSVNEATGLTEGSTNVLPAETFYWNIGTIKTTELAMRYYVYLDGSMEGTREAGSYSTNEYALLYYNNYLNQPTGQPCQKPTVSPVVAWKAANVSYAFYLVDDDGNIIVNQTTGETGPFSRKIPVTNPVVYHEILLNNIENVQSINVASLGVLPDGYELYDNGAVYTIEIKSDATGSWTIGKGTSKATTYVTHYDLANPTAYSNELSKDSNADFTHTVVWFAVKWKVQAMPDTVVIDYGLPVDIDVLSNDMFGANGKLAGVGAVENLPAGYDSATEGGAELSGNFSTERSSTYGTAKADVSTGNVRYTPANMQMNGYDKFAYAVNYTGSSNSGYYYDTVTVIPATTVYYEDNFVDYSSYTWENGWVESESSLWSDSGNASGATQAEDRPGKFSLSDANNIYGYDAANLKMTTYSQGSAKVATVDYDNYAEAEFTFYGTGFDIISMTSNTTGTILVDVVRVDGSVAPKNLIVDTYYGYTQDANGQWIVDPEADGALYQIPVMKVVDLPYGQYKVTVKATYDPAFDHVAPSYAGNYDFYLDAIRIYDPANDGAVDDDNVIENAYAADGEGWPSYFELRNKIIAANSFDKVANDALSTDIEGLVFIDGDAKVGNLQISDYVSYGPNNEVYLASGQSVAFKLANVSNKVANVHIGIKSANGIAGNYTIKNIAAADILDDDGNKQVDAGTEYNAKPYTVETSTDMYYDLGTWKNDIIVITNTSSEDSGAIVSLTNIKATYTENPGNGAVLASEDPVEETTNLVYAYMTPAAATLTLRSLNAPAVEEEEVPETNVPETTVPEVTEPEVEETTEPETQETKPSKPTKPGKEDKETKPTKPGKEDKETKPTKPGKEDKETKPTKPGKEDKATKPTEPANNNKPAINDRTEEVRNNLDKVASAIRNAVITLLGRWF